MTLALAVVLLAITLAGRQGPKPPRGPFEYRPDWWD
jgi:hypothetical protein